MRIFAVIFSLAVSLLAPAMANATWLDARTDHFVLTVDASEEDARAFALRLEQFDHALQLLYGVTDTPDRRSRPIHVYALPQQLFAETCRCGLTVAYYSPRATGSFILTQYVPKVDQKSQIGGWSTQTLLRHEYSHHFMYSNFPLAYPFWYSEGFAEFNANASFEKDGSLIIGYPANYRAEGLRNGGLGMKQLFEPDTYGYPDDMDLLYGRGWLLTNYLMLGPQRKGQLASYLAAMNKGARSYAAAQQAFGNLDTLRDELESYRKGTLAAPLRIPPPAAPLNVTITPYSPGAAEILPSYLLIKDGIARNYRLGTAMTAAKIASRYPDDAVVQTQLAEIEQYAGRLDRADAAADRALAIQPNGIDALVRKGMIASERAASVKPADAKAWSTARSWFLKANRADPNAVMPLYLYYSSFVAAKEKPSAGAVNALLRAAVLAPESRDIRHAAARQKLIERDAATARDLLQPIAFAPHRRRDRNIPREVITLIDEGKIDEAIALITLGEDKDREGD
ncbi:hypothetical protein [Sphingomonas sp. OTU376]|uniref:hypothetical protein n=1 Tax=Sphingomonas sp. OTU376 TaxID=3043863 RepID=UPI00313E1EC2